MIIFLSQPLTAVNLILMTVMIMQHVIILSPISTTVHVMMASLEMACIVKVSVTDGIYPTGMYKIITLQLLTPVRQTMVTVERMHRVSMRDQTRCIY